MPDDFIIWYIKKECQNTNKPLDFDNRSEVIKLGSGKEKVGEGRAMVDEKKLRNNGEEFF